jgi:chromosome segregation ATPase
MKPEQVIRRYLDDHGGSVDARVDHLRVSFHVDELTPAAQTSIAEALERVGIRAEPPLGRLAPDDRLSLRLAGGNGEIGQPAADNGDAAAEPRQDLERIEDSELAWATDAEPGAGPEAEQLAVELQEARSERDSAIAELESTLSARIEVARELEAANLELERSRAELAELSERVTDTEAERDRLAEQAGKLREELAQVGGAQSDVLERQTAALGDLNAARMEKKQLAERLESASRSEASVREQLQGELEAATGKLAERERELADTQGALEGVRGELEQANSRVDELERREQDTRQDLTAARAELERERERGRSLMERLEAIGRAHAQTAAQLEDERSEREGAIRRLGEALVRVLEGRGPVAIAREEFDTARQEHERLSAAVRDAERELERAETKAAEMRGRALDNRSRRADLERALRALTSSQREAEETAGRQREKLAQLGPRLEFAHAEARRLAEKADEVAARLAAARGASSDEDGDPDGEREEELRRLGESEADCRRDAEVRQSEAVRLEIAVADARGRLARFEEAATEKGIELERLRGELARLETRDPEGPARQRYEPPTELRAKVAQLKADVDDAARAMESARLRLEDAERRLAEAQEALEQAVAAAASRKHAPQSA